MKKLLLIVSLLFLILNSKFLILNSVLAAENPVSVQNSHFYLGNNPFKFVGFNINSLIRVDLPETERALKLQFLADECGVSVIRLFYPEGDYCDLNSLKSALKLGSENGIRFIITLGDSAVNNTTWFYGRSLDSYKQKALETINALKNEYGNAILGWELLNEPHCNYPNVADPDGCRRSFYSFMKDFSLEIKSIDPSHLVFSGMIGMVDDLRSFWSTVEATGSEYVAIHRLPSIDACESHPYIQVPDNPDEKIPQYLSFVSGKASIVGKPFFIEEFNDWEQGRRVQSIGKAIDLTFAGSGDGLLVWPLAGDDIYAENNPICKMLKQKADLYGAGKKSPYSLPTTPGQPPSLSACPVEIYPCGQAGQEPNAFYPYPGSTCYRTVKSPKVTTNYSLEAQKTFRITVPVYSACPVNPPLWEFTAEAESDNLKIPVVRQVSELFEGQSPFNRKKSLDENGPILEKYSPLVKLIPYTPKLDILKQIMAVSAIDSQCAPPANCIPNSVGEFSDNPVHDYIIAYAIPAEGQPADCTTDKNWWYAGEEMKEVAGARPIRASELDCTAFMVDGSLPKHAEAEKAGFREQSLYADVVCPKLYGQPFGSANGIYVQELKKQGKMLCPLSEQVRVEVWKEFMPVVSHETEPAETSLTFDPQPIAKGKIYLPHLARLAQLSKIFKETLNPKMEEPKLSDIFSKENVSQSTLVQEIICPAKDNLSKPPAEGCEEPEAEISEEYYGSFKICVYKMTQPGNLKVEIPELVEIQANLTGDNGFFRAWLPKEISQKIDEEVLGNDALEGEGKIKIAGDSGTTISPSEISLKYPYLRSVERYYQEFLKMIIPKID